jgi:hypothetical protein
VDQHDGRRLALVEARLDHDAEVSFVVALLGVAEQQVVE